ncbi:hypothetical protein GCM10023080_022870 [Streptomyces pseudoechinosporeus]
MRAGGDEGVVRGPGDVAAPVAVGGLVQTEGDVDDAGSELQDVRVVGQQLEHGVATACVFAWEERARKSSAFMLDRITEGLTG